MRRVVVLMGALLALVSCLPSQAQASTVSVAGTELVFEAAAGEINIVEVKQDVGLFVGIRDVGGSGPPAAGPGCMPADTSGFVFCLGTTGVNSVKIVTGDRNDTLRPLGSFFGVSARPFDVDLGSGDDEAPGPPGDGLAHTIKGGPGNDRLSSGPGDDTLEGGEGDDRLFMGESDDDFSGGTSFNEGGVPHSDSVEAGFFQRDGVVMAIGQGGIGGDVEVLRGASGPDRLLGDGNGNGLDGSGGDDEITGGAGRDGITGGFGDDTIHARDGEVDTIDCGAGTDTAIVDPDDRGTFGGAPLDCDILLTGAEPIVVTGGGDASSLDLKIDTTAGGFAYTFTDTAPLTVVDGRCQAGPPLTCTTPLEVAVTLDLGAGDDTMTLSGSHPFVRLTVDGGAGNDTLVASPVARGGGDNDTITAGNCPSAGECLHEGGPGDDTLEGGGGSDRLRGGTGSDTISGGNEVSPFVDTVDYADFTNGVQAELGPLGGSVEPAPEFGQDVVEGDVENLTGGGGADLLTGDERVNKIEGGPENDELEGGDESDRLLGGPGRDVLRGGLGSDILDGGDEVDTADYSDFVDRVVIEVPGSSTEPGSGQDSIGGDIENATGGDGDDELTGGDAGNALAGGPGEDTLRGRGGDDRLDGGGDADMLEGGEADEGQDEFFGGPGRDTLTYDGLTVGVVAEIGGPARIGGEPVADSVAADIERLEGGSAADVLTGSAGPDDLIGNGGDDVLSGEAGGDELEGGDGDDTVSYEERSNPVTVTVGDFVANDGESGEFDSVDVENVVGGSGGDLLIGDEGDNRLEGGGGVDTLRGGEGQDELSGGPDGDRLEGGDEFDSLRGGSGADALLGEDGSDALHGDDGEDTLDGGPGSDLLDGGADRDTLLYSDRTQGVSVDPEPGLFPPADDGEPGEGDVVRDTVEDIVGGEGDDVLTGTADANELLGHEGDDTLSGGGGNDRLVGGDDLIDGADTLSGGDGDDELLGGDDQDVISGDAGRDRLVGGPAFDSLRGGSGADALLGEDGSDALHGDEGEDTLDGGPGSDLLDGGADRDTLLYSDRTQGVSVDPEAGGPAAPADDGEIGEGDQVADTVENVTGGSGDDALTGTADANTLVGNDGKDVLNGLGGPDVLEGGRDADTLLSQDGVRDEDFCGPSFDSVAADVIDNVSVDCEVVTFPVQPPPPPAPAGVNTPPGTNVVVQPTDPATLSQPVTVTFSSVTAPGQTSVVSSPVGPAVPSGFQLGNPPRFYELSTTAQFTPPVTVCLNTTGITFPGGLPRLFHFENGTWRDVTTSVGPGPQVCGVVSSLSPFAAFARKRAVKVVRCVVPNVRGKTLAAARKVIKRANCAVGRVRRTHSAKVRAGRVASQAPRPGTRLRKGAKVTLVLSRGRRK